MATATTREMTRSARASIAAVFADFDAAPGKIARRGSSVRTIAYVSAGHAQYTALAAKMPKPVGDGRIAAGILIVEWLQPHQDGLSVAGLYLHGTDDFAPAHELIWVTAAAADGSPDIEYLCRAGGKAARVTDGPWK